jgi:hypothetical protein
MPGVSGNPGVHRTADVAVLTGCFLRGRPRPDPAVRLISPPNGKSSTLQARIMLALNDGEQVAYTCHRVDSSQEVFRGLVTLVEASPELSPLLARVVYSNGKEAVWLSNGARVVFGTRSSRTGRGFSLDLLVLDEAHYLSLEAHTALMPTMSAREHPPQGVVRRFFCR